MAGHYDCRAASQRAAISIVAPQRLGLRVVSLATGLAVATACAIWAATPALSQTADGAITKQAPSGAEQGAGVGRGAGIGADSGTQRQESGDSGSRARGQAPQGLRPDSFSGPGCRYRKRDLQLLV